MADGQTHFLMLHALTCTYMTKEKYLFSLIYIDMREMA